MGGNQALDFFFPTRAYTNDREKGNKIGRFLMPVSSLKTEKVKVDTSAPIVSTPSDASQKAREERLTALRRKGNSSTILSSSMSSDSAMSNETLGRKTLFYP